MGSSLDCSLKSVVGAPDGLVLGFGALTAVACVQCLLRELLPPSLAAGCRTAAVGNNHLILALKVAVVGKKKKCPSTQDVHVRVLGPLDR